MAKNGPKKGFKQSDLHKQRIRDSKLKYKPTELHIKNARNGLINHISQNREEYIKKSKNRNTKHSEEHKKWLRNFYIEHPEKHPNRIIASRMKELGSHYCSKNQLELYYLIKAKYPKAELEYPIKTNYSIRFADIAIPSKKIDIEFDGERWHQNKQLDDLRTKHLNEVGWTVIRFTKGNIHLCLPILEKEVVGNAKAPKDGQGTSDGGGPEENIQGLNSTKSQEGNCTFAV